MEDDRLFPISEVDRATGRTLHVTHGAFAARRDLDGAVQAGARVNVKCVTPLGEEVASIW